MTERFYKEYAVLHAIYDAIAENFDEDILNEIAPEARTLYDIDFSDDAYVADIDLEADFRFDQDERAYDFFLRVLTDLDTGDRLYGLKRSLYGYLLSCVLTRRDFETRAKETGVTFLEYVEKHVEAVAYRRTIITARAVGIDDIFNTIDAFIQPVVV